MAKTFLPFLLALSRLATAKPVQKSLRRQTDIGAIVNTTLGQVQGQASALRSGVSEYLGIPFAQPPVGDLRFEAPVAADAYNGTFSATAYSPDCPCNRIPTSEAYIAGQAGQAIMIAEAQTNDALGEDCLTLNVWTKPQSGEASKSVLMWIYGGGFSTGNTASPMYDGAVLADENDVVVVSANYRLNIFGFSGAPGQETNVGILDQRLALEWARDNVASFGGDPTRITVFGQSAGGASTDLVAYGWPEDPIAHAIIPQSGVLNSAIGSSTSAEDVLENWFTASETAGCGGQDAGTSTVACMKTKTWQEILDAIEPIGFTGLQSGFGPFPDDKVFPSDVQAAGEAGDFAHIPTLIGNTINEAAFFPVVAIAYTDVSAGFVEILPISLIQPVLDLATMIGFTCPSANAVKYRMENGIPAWRYMYYGGNYSNTYLYPVGSDYHTSELPVLFGTAASVTGIADSDVEAGAGQWMRNAWAAFAKDPVNGLSSSSIAWPEATTTDSYIAQLSLQSQTTPTYTDSSDIDWACPTIDAVSDLFSTVSSVLEGVSSLFFGSNDTTTSGLGSEALETLTNLTKSGYNDTESLKGFIAGLQDVETILDGIGVLKKNKNKKNKVGRRQKVHGN